MGGQPASKDPERGDVQSAVISHYNRKGVEMVAPVVRRGSLFCTIVVLFCLLGTPFRAVASPADPGQVAFGDDSGSQGLDSGPAPPTGVTATPISSSKIRVTWTDNSTDEIGFRVTDGGNPVSVGGGTSFVWTRVAGGSYKCFAVQSFNFAGSSPFSAYACATTPSVVAPPTGVTATAISSSEIRVTWTDNSNNEAGFWVYDGVTRHTVNRNVNSYTWSGLAAGTYKCYSVESFFDAETWSQPSAQACTTTPPVPAAPAGVTAIPISASEIRVTWTDTSNNETGFRVSDGTIVTPVGANTNSYVWGGLAQGTYRCFFVQAYNLAGSSTWSTQACTSTPTVPAAPTGLSATAISSSEIRVTWTDTSNNEAGFRVSDGNLVTPVGANTASYVWGGLAPGMYRCFFVQAYNLAGSSSWSTQACTSTPTVPAAPTGLSATAISSSEIRVAWIDASANEDGFRVTDGATTVTVAANTASFTWGGLAAGTSKCFRVHAYNLAGSSSWSNQACTTTVPVAPTGVSATAISASEIRVAWTDDSGNEDGFRITDGFTTAAAAANATSFTWGGLSPGTSRCFRVHAYNTGGSSTWSTQACATIPTLPAAPTGLSATPTSASEIRLTWTDASGNEDGFRISDGFTTATVPANTTSFSWGGLSPGTSRCFSVQAYNLAGASSSTRACTTTPTMPAAPTGLTATAISSSEIRVAWADNSNNEDGFRVSEMEGTGTVAADTTSFVVNGLLPATRKCFAVESFNLAGSSPSTPWVCAATQGGLKGE